MNQQKGKENKNLSEPRGKSCSRHRDHAEKSTTATTVRKYDAHTGIKLNLKVKKPTTVMPFSFDKHPSKNTECHSREKPNEKQPETEKKDSADSGPKVKTVMERPFKIAMSTEITSIEEASLKVETPSTPSKEHTPKPQSGKTVNIPLCSSSGGKTCRCSKAMKCLLKTTETKPEVKPLKVAKSKEQPLETKPQTRLPSKMVKSQTAWSKMERVKAMKPEPKTSTPIKSKSKPANARNSEVKAPRDAENNGGIIEKSECMPSSSNSVGECVKFCSSKAEKSECIVLVSQDHESDDSNTEELVLLNGARHESEISIDAKQHICMLLNGITSEFETSNRVSPDSESSNETKNELSATKSSSKIPRITKGTPAGLKLESNTMSDSIPQPLSSEA